MDLPGRKTRDLNARRAKLALPQVHLLTLFYQSSTVIANRWRYSDTGERRIVSGPYADSVIPVGADSVFFYHRAIRHESMYRTRQLGRPNHMSRLRNPGFMGADRFNGLEYTDLID